MMKLLICALALFCASCVATSGDIRDIADRVADFEDVLGDETKDVGDVKAALGVLKDDLVAVADAAAERGEETLTGMASSAEGGLLGVGAAIALNLYRNSRRRKRGETV